MDQPVDQEPPLRRAIAGDGAAIRAVMAASARELSRGFYSDAQIPGVVAHVAVLDEQLIADGTYFVVEDADGMCACGGWSYRDKLFSGGGAAAGGAGRLRPGLDPARIRAMFVHPRAARRGLGRRILEAAEADARAAGFTCAELMATAPGEPLYAVAGYRVLERVEVVLPDGGTIACARMRKDLAAAP